MTHAELEKVKSNIYDATLNHIYSQLIAAGLEVNDSRLRDAVVCALEEAAARFCTPEFGTSPEEE